MIELARMCTACRTAYAEGDSCAGGDGHEVVTLDDPAQRQRMIEAVWGDPDQRRRAHARERTAQRHLQRLVLAGGLAGFVGGLFLGPVGAVTVYTLGGTFAGGLLGHATRSRDVSAYPVGAAPRPLPRVSARGVVRGAGGVESPASGESCAAWSLELRYDGSWGERVMLRAGASAGLEIALDGGEVLRIAAGPVVLTEAAQQVDELSAARVQAVVRALDPLGVPIEHFTPVPYNVVAEAMLFVGDRVEILGEMDRRVVAGAADLALYRDAPPSQLVPRGVPILRRV